MWINITEKKKEHSASLSGFVSQLRIPPNFHSCNDYAGHFWWETVGLVFTFAIWLSELFQTNWEPRERFLDLWHWNSRPDLCCFSMSKSCGHLGVLCLRGGHLFRLPSDLADISQHSNMAFFSLAQCPKISRQTMYSSWENCHSSCKNYLLSAITKVTGGRGVFVSRWTFLSSSLRKISNRHRFNDPPPPVEKETSL